MARSRSTICPPISKDAHLGIVGDPGRCRRWPEETSRRWPQPSPKAFAQGYRPKDDRTSAEIGPRLRRVRPKSAGVSYSVRPSFAPPYVTGPTDDFQGPSFPRAFGVPFRATSRASGKDPMYWYRLEVGLGRNGVVGATARRADLPEHLLADEHHQTRDGQKDYVATAVGGGRRPGAALAQTAGNEDLQAAYAVFEREAKDARPDPRPRTASVDGRAATRHAWPAPFPPVVLPRRFLHGRLDIRGRAEPSGAFAALPEEAWGACHAPTREGLSGSG